MEPSSAAGSGGGGPGPYEEEEPSLLVVVLDADPTSWGAIHAIGERARGEGDAGALPEAARALTTFPRLIDALLLFLDAHLLTHRANRVAVLAATPDRSDFLYPSPPSPQAPATEGVQGAAVVDRVGQAVVEGLRRLVGDGGEEDGQQGRPQGRRQGSLVAQALSKGLCYIQRALREQAPFSARLLVLQASPDAHADYNALMNCIFSAHRSAVPIDACVLSYGGDRSPMMQCPVGPRDSSFLQQAAYITGGVYVRPERQDALLQYFLSLFLPGHRLRQILRLPKQESVDFRAACFCHRRAVEQAYVCSVCLSIFCAYSLECATCGTPARPPKQQSRNAAAMLPAAASEDSLREGGRGQETKTRG